MPSTLDYAPVAGDSPRGTRIRARVSWPLMLGAIYVPYAWLLAIGHVRDNYHQLWLKLWPILPGLIPGILVGHTDTERFAVMGGATGVLLAVLLLPFRWPRSPFLVIPIAAAVLMLSALNSYLAYALYRM